VTIFMGALIGGLASHELVNKILYMNRERATISYPLIVPSWGVVG
jgi:hypothetical protein